MKVENKVKLKKFIVIVYLIGISFNIMELGIKYIDFETIPIINRINLLVMSVVAIFYPVLDAFGDSAIKVEVKNNEA